MEKMFNVESPEAWNDISVSFSDTHKALSGNAISNDKY